MPLIVTGSIGIDSIETPTGHAENVLGGSAIYFAAGASYFTPVRLVGAVGEDFPTDFLKTFEHFAIDTAGLEMRQGSLTFRWRGKYHENMNDRDTLSVELNVLAEHLPAVPDHYRDSRYVFLANTHPAGQLELLEQFPSRDLVVADTMDLWIETERRTLLELLKRIDGLVLNDSEAKLLTDDDNLVRAAEKIVDMGPKFVIVKKGEHGALLHHRDGQAVLPAYPTADVIDPTGAGDAFAGGFMGYLAGVEDTSLPSLKRAIACGAVVASYNVESFSLKRLEAIGRGDIDERLLAYRQMVDIDGATAPTGA